MPTPSRSNTSYVSIGLILLGNSGAGKSFLLNTLIGRDRFASRVSAVSVTRDVGVTTEDFDVDGEAVAVRLLDIPGLIEASQEQINMNKAKIYKAFQMQPISIVDYVFKVFG